MIRRIAGVASATAVTLILTTMAALAQRPPSGTQGPPEMSLARAWAWLMARPGVMIAIAICLVAIAYMVLAKKKSKT